MKTPWFRRKWATVLLHTAFWVLLFVLPYLLQPSSAERRPHRTEESPRNTIELFNLAKGIFWVGVFYLNAYVLMPRLWKRRRHLGYILSLVAIAVLLSQFEIFYFRDSDRPFNLNGFLFFNLFPFLFILTASTAYHMYTERVAEEKNRSEREAEHLKSELQFLRSQISPHFMFNVLNNIVALARKGSDQVEPSLIRLSTLLRYFLYENAKGTITLEKEIEYLKNYIELQEQRFGKATVVRFTTQGPDAPYEIEPMLLIPFVENAFKHGIIQNGSISIGLEARNSLLHFTVKNRYRHLNEAAKDATSGIGLANVRRRLNLLYGGRHTLTIDDRDEQYVISLQIKLH